MTGLLRLANEFIERMMNPAFGPLVNDDYSMQLGQLLDDDPNVERLLLEARRLSRVDELSAYTWAWLLCFPGSETALSSELLLHLCQQFRAPAFRVTVINCAMRGRPRLERGEEVTFESPPTLQDIESPWLSELVRSAVQIQIRELPEQSPEQEANEVVEARTVQDAQSLLVSLLTVDWRECQEAAAALLHHEWSGQPALLTFFEARTRAMDEESRERWLRLGPPT